MGHLARVGKGAVVPLKQQSHNFCKALRVISVKRCKLCLCLLQFPVEKNTKHSFTN